MYYSGVPGGNKGILDPFSLCPKLTKLLLPSGAANTPQSRVQSATQEVKKFMDIKEKDFYAKKVVCVWTGGSLFDIPNLWPNNFKAGF